MKMQKVIVLNRKQARELTYNDFSLNRVIISISSQWDNPPVFNSQNHSIREVCYCNFDDEEVGENIMTDRDAEKIANFAKKWWDKCDQIVVHCDAGVSRSAGVAGAILKHFTGSDAQIFYDWFYVPNMLCYRKVLNALHKLEEE